MYEKPTTDEEIKKFIETNGIEAWIKLLSGGEPANQYPKAEKPDVSEWVKKIHGF